MTGSLPSSCSLLFQRDPQFTGKATEALWGQITWPGCCSQHAGAEFTPAEPQGSPQLSSVPQAVLSAGGAEVDSLEQIRIRSERLCVYSCIYSMGKQLCLS